MHGSLKKEMWLPVLNDEGKVVGCIARSVSRILPKKYFHPIVRIILSYKGMLYLVKRPSDEFLSPDLLDHPLHSYVVFRHSIQETVLDLTEKACQQQDAFTPSAASLSISSRISFGSLERSRPRTYGTMQ